MSKDVVVRIWKGARVAAIISADGEGNVTMLGPVGGAANSIKVDIELDPWAQLITDNRAEWPAPVSIRERMNEGDES